MSVNQPTSFRLPFTLPEDVHPQVQNALRLTYQGVKDLNDAIRHLNDKVNTNTAGITNINQAITATTGGTSGGGGASSVFGFVNLQPNLTPGAYTIVQADYGGLIYVHSAIPFSITLNSGVTAPFFAVIYNFGPGNVIMTPSLGLVNSVGSLPIIPGELALVYFGSDGNWYVAYIVIPQTIGHLPSNWLDSYNAATGVFTRSQPSVHDLVDSTTGAGKVVLESGPILHASGSGTGIISILGLSIFANNAAALGGGLIVGNLYRTGLDPDTICVVH